MYTIHCTVCSKEVLFYKKQLALYKLYLEHKESFPFSAASSSSGILSLPIGVKTT